MIHVSSPSSRVESFTGFYFAPSQPRKTRTETSREERSEVAGSPRAGVCPAARFSLVCKLAVSNEFWEAAPLPRRPDPSRAPPSTLPSQICPDVPSLSGAAPGEGGGVRSAVGRSGPAPFPPLSGLEPAEPCKSLPR